MREGEEFYSGGRFGGGGGLEKCWAFGRWELRLRMCERNMKQTNHDPGRSLVVRFDFSNGIRGILIAVGMKVPHLSSSCIKGRPFGS